MLSFLHKNNIRACFNCAAVSYDDFAQVQWQVGCGLTERLKKYRAETFTIVDIGCGSGKVTQKLAEEMNYQNFFAIDFAENLLAKAKKRLHATDINILQIDFDTLQGCFDIIFANMALQWSIDLNATIHCLKKNMTTNSILAFSLPLTDTFHELGEQRNKFHSDFDIKKILATAGLQLLHASTEKIIEVHESKLVALKAIRAMGANYLFRKNTRQFLSELRLKKSFSLTYEIGYFIVIKLI